MFVITGPRRRARLRLQGSFFVVGRAEPFPVFHDDPTLSREHLAVVARPDGVRVRDLGSPNGVLLNGQRLARYAEVTLAPGDVLVAGRTELRLLTEAERAALDAGAPVDEHAVDAEGGTRAVRLDAVVAAAAASAPPPPDPGSPPAEPDDVGGEATSELDVPSLPEAAGGADPAPAAGDDDPRTLGDLPTGLMAPTPSGEVTDEVEPPTVLE